MKNLFLILTLTFSCGLFAQNWNPFPYDSVFFENNTPHQIMLPFVKTANNQIEYTHNRSILSTSFHSINHFSVYATSYIKPWLGGIIQTNNQLSFIGTFNDTITININANAYIDTIPYTFDLVELSDDSTENILLPYYLMVDKQMAFNAVNSDSLMKFYFTLLDSNLIQTDCIDDLICYNSINGDSLILSKLNGVVSVPNFGLFPFTKQYNLGQSFETELGNFNFSERIHLHNIGDEIHTENHYLYNPKIEISKKMVVTGSTYSVANNQIYNTYDVWKRTDKTTNPAMGVWVDTTFVSQYTFTDTIEINQPYNNLTNGIADNWYNEPGYYYKKSKYNNRIGLYKLDLNGGKPFLNDTINHSIKIDLGIVDAVENHTNFYIEGLSFDFFENFDSWETHYFRPVYFNLSGSTWGDPFTDSFILETPVHQNQTTHYIYNNTLFWKSDLEIEMARIYNINGQLIEVFNSVNKTDNIRIDNLAKGSYFLVLKTKTSGINIKFIKQ